MKDLSLEGAEILRFTQDDKSQDGRFQPTGSLLLCCSLVDSVDAALEQQSSRRRSSKSGRSDWRKNRQNCGCCSLCCWVCR